MYKFIDEGRKHLHTLKGQPLYGTSTVCGILAKPLTWWAAGCAVEKFGWLSDKKHPTEAVKQAAREGWERVKSLSLPEYEKLLTEAYKAHNEVKKEAAEGGVDMHAELEKYVKECIAKGGSPIVSDSAQMWQVDQFSAWAIKNVDKFLWSEGHTYSEQYWIGGIIDAGALMKNGNVAILDFKSSKDAYYSQGIQCAGYALQVEERGIVTSEGEQLLDPMHVNELIVVPFGAENIVPTSIQNVEGFKQAFIGALNNYVLNQAFENRNK